MGFQGGFGRIADAFQRGLEHGFVLFHGLLPAIGQNQHLVAQILVIDLGMQRQEVALVAGLDQREVEFPVIAFPGFLLRCAAGKHLFSIRCSL